MKTGRVLTLSGAKPMSEIEQLSKHKSREADQREAYRIEQERHKAFLRLLVDVLDGVQMAVRNGGPEDDLYGTLKRVNRTRCLVLMVGREWDMPLELVAVSTASQRMAITARVLSRPADKVKQMVLPKAVLDAIENGALKRPILH